MARLTICSSMVMTGWPLFAGSNSMSPMTRLEVFRDGLADRGATQHRLVELLERAAGDEEDARGVDRVRPAVDVELDVLVLHQREQRFLRHDAAHVRVAADLRADLVDFVDEDDAVLDGAKENLDGRVGA